MKGKAKGGYARAAALSPQRRTEISRQAAVARWSKPMRAGQESETLEAPDKLLIYELVKRAGFQHKRVAALFDVNQGRIAEAVAEVEKFLKGDATTV